MYIEILILIYALSGNAITSKVRTFEFNSHFVDVTRNLLQRDSSIVHKFLCETQRPVSKLANP